MFLAGIWVLESTEQRVWSQALAEEPFESTHLVQPRPVQGQLELCCANRREFYFSCALVSHCRIAHLSLLSLDEKQQRSCVKADVFW